MLVGVQPGRSIHIPLSSPNGAMVRKNQPCSASVTDELMFGAVAVGAGVLVGVVGGSVGGMGVAVGVGVPVGADENVGVSITGSSGLGSGID